MNTKMTKLALALGALVMAGGAMAATANLTATATVITPIAITQTVPLAFGSFSTSEAAQTVAVSAAGGRTATGALLSMKTSPTAAAFTITGEESYTFALTMPAAAQTLTHTDNTSTMAVVLTAPTAASGYTAIVGTGTAWTGVIGKIDDLTHTLFTVGGTLTTVAAQTPGVYSGSYAVTVEYN
jgi:hypothetical protein